MSSLKARKRTCECVLLPLFSAGSWLMAACGTDITSADAAASGTLSAASRDGEREAKELRGHSHTIDPSQLDGQQVVAGANIARIANPAKLKAEIRVAETQARDSQFDQRAQIDTRNGIIPGHVIRIDPAVQDGTVAVDIKLDGPLPRGARPDLSVDGTITLERLENALYVGRPVNGQADSLISLYKIVDAGKAAIRTRVKLGRTSVSSIEVVEGLQVGDQIILSDMAQWDSHERIRLR